VPNLQQADRIAIDFVANFVCAHDQSAHLAIRELLQPRAATRKLLELVRRARERVHHCLRRSRILL
jgi:hypothetical protein